MQRSVYGLAGGGPGKEEAIERSDVGTHIFSSTRRAVSSLRIPRLAARVIPSAGWGARLILQAAFAPLLPPPIHHRLAPKVRHASARSQLEPTLARSGVAVVAVSCRVSLLLRSKIAC
jgi:hypothetical protein